MKIRVLGPVEVFDGDRLGRGRRREAAAADRHPARSAHVRSFPIDQLVLELWGDTPPKTAATQVHGYVLRLRRLLGDPDGRVLITAAPGYRLVLGDARHRRAAVRGPGRRGPTGSSGAAAPSARPRCSVRRSRCGAARPSPTYRRRRPSRPRRRGSPSSGWPRWTPGSTPTSTCGRHAMLIGELQQLVEEHPLREQGWHRLMLALFRGGRQAEALQAFQRVRAILVDELGVEPGAALRELHQQLLAGDGRATSPRRRRAARRRRCRRSASCRPTSPTSPAAPAARRAHRAARRALAGRAAAGRGDLRRPRRRQVDAGRCTPRAGPRRAFRTASSTSTSPARPPSRATRPCCWPRCCTRSASPARPCPTACTPGPRCTGR